MARWMQRLTCWIRGHDNGRGLTHCMFCGKRVESW